MSSILSRADFVTGVRAVSKCTQAALWTIDTAVKYCGPEEIYKVIVNGTAYLGQGIGLGCVGNATDGSGTLYPVATWQQITGGDGSAVVSDIDARDAIVIGLQTEGVLGLQADKDSIAAIYAHRMGPGDATTVAPGSTIQFQQATWQQSTLNVGAEAHVTVTGIADGTSMNMGSNAVVNFDNQAQISRTLMQGDDYTNCAHDGATVKGISYSSTGHVTTGGSNSTLQTVQVVAKEWTQEGGPDYDLAGPDDRKTVCNNERVPQGNYSSIVQDQIDVEAANCTDEGFGGGQTMKGGLVVVDQQSGCDPKKYQEGLITGGLAVLTTVAYVAALEEPARVFRREALKHAVTPDADVPTEFHVHRANLSALRQNMLFIAGQCSEFSLAQFFSQHGLESYDQFWYLLPVAGLGMMAINMAALLENRRDAALLQHNPEALRVLLNNILPTVLAEIAKGLTLYFAPAYSSSLLFEVMAGAAFLKAGLGVAGDQLHRSIEAKKRGGSNVNSEYEVVLEAGQPRRVNPSLWMSAATAFTAAGVGVGFLALTWFRTSEPQPGSKLC